MGLELTIVTPERQVFAGPVEDVLLPGSEGDFGVLEHHERFLSPLRIGAARIHAADGVVHAAMGEGFSEVTGERVTVLVDTCELADQIDAARAESARERAERGIREVESGEAEAHLLEVHRSALRRAEVRLEVTGKPV